ncbi:hypothetical protein E2542_SST07324 [Spatholobus suberectus]|nr:hypothetical protein E2542_SST07324 [Spatholobus suberectus]
MREAPKPKRRERSRATLENDHCRARRCLVLLPCRIHSLSPISYGHLTEAAMPRETRSRSHKLRPHRCAKPNVAACSKLRPTDNNPFTCPSPAVIASPLFSSRSLMPPPFVFFLGERAMLICVVAALTVVNAIRVERINDSGKLWKYDGGLVVRVTEPRWSVVVGKGTVERAIA